MAFVNLRLVFSKDDHVNAENINACYHCYLIFKTAFYFSAKQGSSMEINLYYLFYDAIDYIGLIF